MALTIFLVVLFLAVVGVAGRSFFERQYQLYWRLGAGALTGLFLLCLICSTATVVSTRNVGIVTTMGRPNGELSNGFHVVAPWQDVTEMDGAIQLQKFEGDHSMEVRLGNNSTAKANVTIQWRLDPRSAPSLFLDYRSFKNIEENLVDKELGVAMNTELAKFDPLAPGNSDGAPLVDISTNVQRDVQTAVGHRIEIQRVFVPLLSYDPATQDRINALNVEKANTRVAEQAKKTAEAQSEANKILAATVSNDPNVISNNCITASIAKNLPVQGCWPLPAGGLTIATPGGK